MKTIEEIYKELPPDLQKEVYDFANYLLDKRAYPKQKKMRLSWAKINTPHWSSRKRRWSGGVIDVPGGHQYLA
jgi:hypothetical protein